MILGGLGADVVAVEPPDGSPARRLAPFAGDVPGSDRSLVHWATNRGKRSAVLDLTGSEGDRDRFRLLVAAADVLFETRARGSSTARLRRRRPGGDQPGARPRDHVRLRVDGPEGVVACA